MSSQPAGMSSKAEKWLDKLRQSNHALVLLFFLSMLEATIIPIPLELILIPYMLIERERIWLLASVALAGCMAGALLGYGVGQLLFDSVGHWFIAQLGAADEFEAFKQTLQDDGFWAVFMVGVTPVPFQVAMLAAGVTGYSLLMFTSASFLSRGLRYYGLAVLVLLVGERATAVWQNHAGKLGASLLALALLVVGWQYFN
ncbi:YqaA family protein [Bowmanella yangjiangensis]|uniref:DedA family protein n=1 Tax=Bowmanella yangjiangensis TaxID=2811230 RepID=A0ABS3CYG6_9ALTE|nr:VTT domain-containing protein [Bowmanella yangjiangensis]MBN7821146.1 DedA family protein [Bowmanella yangjiangensis]